LVELWTTYREAPTDEVRHKLIEEYAPLAKYVVDRMNIRASGSVSYDDLVGTAVLGLIEAIDRFDPQRGVKFNTYAYYRIRGAVMDMLREQDWVPRSLRAKSTDIVNTIARLEGELGRQPTDVEVANAMGIDLSRYDDMVQDVAGTSVLSLEDIVEGHGGDRSVPVLDTIPDEQAVQPDEHVEYEDQKRVLAQAISDLPENEKMVIALYYQDGLTLKEIGKVLGVTESRICQIHSKAVLRLRAMMKTAFPL
jgi:RNA polymerase sigma factor for flagellar operon FliA